MGFPLERSVRRHVEIQLPIRLAPIAAAPTRLWDFEWNCVIKSIRAWRVDYYTWIRVVRRAFSFRKKRRDNKQIIRNALRAIIGQINYPRWLDAFHECDGNQDNNNNSHQMFALGVYVFVSISTEISCSDDPSTKRDVTLSAASKWHCAIHWSFVRMTLKCVFPRIYFAVAWPSNQARTHARSPSQSKWIATPLFGFFVKFLYFPFLFIDCRLCIAMVICCEIAINCDWSIIPKQKFIVRSVFC